MWFPGNGPDLSFLRVMREAPPEIREESRLN
jgi:hypothetical protein